MTSVAHPLRITLLVVAHFVLGVGVAALAISEEDWSHAWSSWYFALIGSEILLLAVWTSFSERSWIARSIGFGLGSMWLAFLGLASVLSMLPDFPESAQFPLTLVLVPLIVLTIGGVVIRRFAARLVRCDVWPHRTWAQELQFSLAKLIGLTIMTSLLLGCGRFLHVVFLRYDFETSIIAIVLSVQLILGSLAIAWACLGDGRLRVRIPAMLIAQTAAGLLLPLFLRLDEHFFLLWAGIGNLVGVFAGLSLLVVRSCGYRIVSRGRQQLDVAKQSPMSEATSPAERQASAAITVGRPLTSEISEP